MSLLPFARFKLFTEGKLLFSVLGSARSLIIFLNVSDGAVLQLVLIYLALPAIMAFLKHKNPKSVCVSALTPVTDITSFRSTKVGSPCL
jgi:hypothetical protein